MLNFISFGSGSCGNCYYLFTENEGLLIDIGVGSRILKKHFHDYGLRFQGGFDAILVTHDHADHIKSVGSVSKKLNIPVYATKLVHNGMDKNYCMRCKIAGDRRRYVECGYSFPIGNFKITPFGVPHDSTDNAGYMIEYGETVFSILTDVGHITPEMNDIIRMSNYLVIEANYDTQMLETGSYPHYLKERIKNGHGHLSNQQCALAIKENYTEKLRHIWLCHLSEENNRPDIADKCVTETLKKEGIDIGRNVVVDILNRKQPTGIFSLE